jgi:hypothetical protein
MKRLLAYLFIVLGFGLTFSVNAGFKSVPDQDLFINSSELSKLEKVKKIKNKKAKINRWNEIYIGQKWLTVKNGYGILKFENGWIFVGYFHNGDLRDGSWIMNGQVDYQTFEYKPKNDLNGAATVTRSKLRPAKEFEIEYLLENVFLKNKISYEEYLKLTGKDKIIAKKEPSQTQKVVSTTSSTNPFKGTIYNIKSKDINKIIIEAFEPTNHTETKNNKIDFQELKEIALQHCNTPVDWDVSIQRGGTYNGVYQAGRAKSVTYNFACKINSSTQIAKTETAAKPKKKVKVAKVEEPKQEEFKPKKTNQDNEAPVIEIAEAITVNDTSYILEGRVTDKADKIFVEIDGQPVQVKKGKFKVKRYSPVDEQIKIVAIDQWGNKSKTKLVSITIDIDETTVANKLEPLNPSNISNKLSNNKVALIIGIENYTEAPKANYANLDAKYFFDYARRAFGVSKQNINLLVNEEATVVKTDKAVSLWLKSKIKKNKSDLIIFFAGHGLASSDGKELYLLPQDGNPDRLERTALSRTDLFKEIISLNPKSVTMFLDTCYSGVSRDEQMLLASARPVRIVADDQEGIPDNFTIFSASQLDQISSGLKEANHGIFSYYLMKGLEGNADSNQDKKITNGELLAYMDENVSQKAAEQGREQNPSLAGDPDKILMSYR